jgi:hypothetical protein
VCISSSTALCRSLVANSSTARIAVRFSVCCRFCCALALSRAHCMELVECEHQLIGVALQSTKHLAQRSKKSDVLLVELVFLCSVCGCARSAESIVPSSID